MTEELKAFEFYGVRYEGKSGNQAYGNCPFCGKDGKFYTNLKNRLWDCKVCGLKGNFTSFLTRIYEDSLSRVSEADLRSLSIDRKLPIKTLSPWRIGKHEDKYVLPIYNEKNMIQDLRTYRIGSKLRSTSGCSVGLLNMHNLVRSPSVTPTYICEGEWDGMAMHWLLNFLKISSIVVAVPGAGTFKREWCTYFKGRDVYICYDNDDAGKNGELTVQERLTGVARSTKYLHWDPTFDDGYDIRDHISKIAIKMKKPSSAFKWIKDHFKHHPRLTKASENPSVGTDSGKNATSNEPLQPASVKDVYSTYGKWLYLKDFRGIEVALATILSNEMEGDPLWMFLVASPGGSKTEILQAFSKCPNTYLTSSLTAHALISGANFTGGRDPSMLPDLHNKTLIIKDFTSILSKKEAEKEEIFGIFRDAYDGSSSKTFGNGQRREYVSHFSILAGVTPVIHELASQHQSFGERFLKYSIGDNLNHNFESEIISKAIGNVGGENLMRQELMDIMYRFIMTQKEKITKYKPTIPPEIKVKLVALSRYGARMRGNVTREKYHTDIMTSKPTAEVGSRIGKQLAKFLIALAYVNDRKEVAEEDYRLCCKVMLDTISQRTEDVVRMLYVSCPTIDDTLRTKDIAFRTRYTMATISHILADLDILGIVTRQGKQNVYEWTLSEYVRDLIAKSEVYKK